MKRCPYCDEEVRGNAIKCKHCGSMLEHTNGDTLDEAVTLSQTGTVSQYDTLDRAVTLGGTSGQPQYDTLDVAATAGGEATVLADQYAIVKKIGEGGMGVVYLAEDTKLYNRKVAIKVLPSILARNIRAVENLRREAHIVIELNHPNIVRLYGFHEDNDIKFLVMEYIDGETLDDRIAKSSEGKLSLEETINIAEKVAIALDYAHSRKQPVFHRDLKPSNIMISKDGIIKLLDFGIAREIHDSYTRVTGKQDTSGTLPYMSPEQLRGQKPTIATDIYSFGITVYECLSGNPPFRTGDIRHQIFHEKPNEITGIASNVMSVLQKALDKEPANRTSSLVEFINLLKNPSEMGLKGTIRTERQTADSNVITIRDFCQDKFEHIFSKEIEERANKLIGTIGKECLRNSKQILLDNLRAAYLELMGVAFSRTLNRDLRFEASFAQSDFLKSNNLEYLQSICQLYSKAFGSDRKDGVLAMANAFYQVALGMPRFSLKAIRTINVINQNFYNFLNKLFEEIDRREIIEKSVDM